MQQDAARPTPDRQAQKNHAAHTHAEQWCGEKMCVCVCGGGGAPESPKMEHAHSPRPLAARAARSPTGRPPRRVAHDRPRRPPYTHSTPPARAARGWAGQVCVCEAVRYWKPRCPPCPRIGHPATASATARAHLALGPWRNLFGAPRAPQPACGPVRGRVSGARHSEVVARAPRLCDEPPRCATTNPYGDGLGASSYARSWEAHARCAPWRRCQAGLRHPLTARRASR
jgi:hypothetical protein